MSRVRLLSLPYIAASPTFAAFTKVCRSLPTSSASRIEIIRTLAVSTLSLSDRCWARAGDGRWGFLQWYRRNLWSARAGDGAMGISSVAPKEPVER